MTHSVSFILIVLFSLFAADDNQKDVNFDFKFNSQDRRGQPEHPQKPWTSYKQAKPVSSDLPPFTDSREAEPHYEDVVPKETIKIDPVPTDPESEPMVPGSLKTPDNVSNKTKQLDPSRISAEGKPLTTQIGVKVSNDQSMLQAGHPGPGLIEDFVFTEKAAHFNRERIPERVVHARGHGAYGVFRVYRSLSDLTTAAFLQDPSKETPVFVRVSTVQGSRGSPDTVRDVRGLATKFYTEEGNMDLVDVNTAIFFIQDPIKFPDLVHAMKPEPYNEVPQAQTAHDSFWDYISLQPETLHNVMWIMSDRGIPRSLRTMEGFAIHTFKMINKEGKVHFVRFHWKPVQGKASLLWDEAQKIAGKDPDFHRKDLWQAIEAGDYPEWELGLQVIPEEDEFKFGFDILDATKLIPESVVPVQYVGKMTLNRNPDNFFAETEQVAFCPANIVPGIDFTDDPLLQGRVFYYGDTQRHRLGTPNFNQITINRPLVDVRNHMRDGFYPPNIPIDANYEPNSISGNWPREVPPNVKGGGFKTIMEKIEGIKSRNRSASFSDYYSQPRLFYLSLLPFEQKHLINAFSFELEKVKREHIRKRVVDHLCRIDHTLAKSVADNLGIKLTQEQLNRKLPDLPCNLTRGDPSLSLYYNNTSGLKSRRINVLITDGVNDESINEIITQMRAVGAHPVWLGPHMGNVTTKGGKKIKLSGSFGGIPSVMADGVIVCEEGRIGNGREGEEELPESLEDNGDAKYQVMEAYKHLKPIALLGSSSSIISAIGLDGDFIDEGVVVGKSDKKEVEQFLEVLKRHRVWEREDKVSVIPA